MPEQQQQDKQKVPFPTLPKALENRISMKWVTLEALGKVAKMVAKGQEAQVILLTAFGQIEGRLCPIQSSYAESFQKDQDHLTPDIASMVTHVRTDLMAMYEKEQSGGGEKGGKSKEENAGLEVIDAAPILSLNDVVLRTGGTTTKLPQLTLFADQVIGFSLVGVSEFH